ncbi:MAG: hypothetical protein R2911_28310 [Caldilineaceae bacterium]
MLVGTRELCTMKNSAGARAVCALKLSQVAGIAYDDVAKATIWGSKENEDAPWLIGGAQR